MLVSQPGSVCLRNVSSEVFRLAGTESIHQQRETSVRLNHPLQEGVYPRYRVTDGALLLPLTLPPALFIDGNVASFRSEGREPPQGQERWTRRWEKTIPTKLHWLSSPDP